MSNVDRTGAVGGSNMRDQSTVKRLQMYRNFKAKRCCTGIINKLWTETCPWWPY